MLRGFSPEASRVQCLEVRVARAPSPAPGAPYLLAGTNSPCVQEIRREQMWEMCWRVAPASRPLALIYLS